MGGLFGGGGPSMPPPPPPAPPAAAPPTMANAQVSQSGGMARSRAAAAAGAGFAGTVQNVGGSPGLTEQASSAPRSLLG
jgi:hypothetical protein